MKKIINFLVLLLCLILIVVLINDRRFDPKDINKDGKVDALDLLVLKKHILEKQEENNSLKEVNK